jgi:RHH-type proline utilization regulon transcriptional repressor/proline dehydrogenase/delta 1-pyrroline-5-carboxylate dehydrogenase
MTRAGLYAQIAAVLATGNSGRVEGMALPAGLPASVQAALAGGNDSPCAAMLVEGDSARVIAAAQEAAAQPGAIMPVHAAEAGRPVPYTLDWLLEEVSTSINTTAAGGNASLMMIG